MADRLEWARVEPGHWIARYPGGGPGADVRSESWVIDGIAGSSWRVSVGGEPLVGPHGGGYQYLAEARAAVAAWADSCEGTTDG